MMLSDKQCIEIRDFLFENRIVTPTGSAPLFSMLAVTTDAYTMGECDAAITYHINDSACYMSGVNGSQHDLLMRVIDNSPFNHMKFEFRNCDPSLHCWPVPWELTAKSDMKNFPLLILLQADDGMVRGVQVRDTHAINQCLHISQEHSSEEQAIEYINALSDLDKGENFEGLIKDQIIRQPSLAAAMDCSPQSEQGLQAILIFNYQLQCWQYGVATHNDSAPASLSLKIVSEPSVPPNAGALGGAIPVVPIELLHEAVACLSQTPKIDSSTFEGHPAIEIVCDVWNILNEGQDGLGGVGEAGAFRLYEWNEQRQLFAPFAYDENEITKEDMEAYNCAVEFHDPDLNLSYYALFLSSKKSNTAEKTESGKEITTSYLVNGLPFAKRECPLLMVDDSEHSMMALQSLALTVLKPSSNDLESTPALVIHHE